MNLSKFDYIFLNDIIFFLSMVDIPEYKRDGSMDYLKVLQSLNEIPFPVGKNLLSDFLVGDNKNVSIVKNRLYEKNNFGSLEFLDRDEVVDLVNDMIKMGFVEESFGFFNRNVKVLSVSINGRKELLDPGYRKKRIDVGKIVESEVTDDDMRAFNELQGFLGDLNIEQKKAVVSPKDKILCIAGAGSGKTTVLTKRIHFLNKMKKVKGEDILAITFTRKARLQMEDRLSRLGVSNVRVETFNSFCEKILLRNTARIYGRRMKVATFHDKMIGVLRALDNMGISIDDAVHRYFSRSQLKNKNMNQLHAMFVNDCFSVFEYYKMTNKSLDDFSSGLKGKDHESARMIYLIVKFLIEHMRTTNMRTYADQINDAVSFFRRTPKQIPRFKHILVDEYQDVNSQQVELLDLLSPENIFCVGDPRQSIFGWRGSDVSFIMDLAKRDDFDVINLKMNYRSNSHIVGFMNKTISYMGLNPLEAEIEYEKDIKLCNFDDDFAEYNYIAAKILSSLSDPSDIFVLARTNRQLSELSDVFRKRGIRHILKTEDEKDVDVKDGHVVLATIHSIKGLEAEEVYVIGCTKRNFPCVASEHPVMEIVKMYDYDKNEEERRLFYVAISRAKNRLYMTYSGKNHTRFITDEMKECVDVLKF